MLIRPGRQAQRSGAAAVETAVVMTVFLLFLFGVFEYCRFLFINQLMVNAAREGARYGVVNTADGTMVADTTAEVYRRMAGMDTKVDNFNVQVYKADSAGNNAGAATDAQFGQYVAVELACDYRPVLPSFLFMANPTKIRYKALMYSEGN